MYCKVWKWHDGKKWMCATVLFRTWSLAMKIFEDIAKSCWISFCLISSKIFNCKLQFLHDVVEDTAFYHCGHFLTIQCFSKWEMEIFCLGEYDLFDLLIMHCKVWKWQDGKKWICAKKLELSSEYFGGYCKMLLNQILFYIFQDIQL